RLERTKAEHLVGDLRSESQAILTAQCGVDLRKSLIGGLLNSTARGREIADVVGQLRCIELVDELFVDSALQLGQTVVADRYARPRVDGRRGHWRDKHL